MLQVAPAVVLFMLLSNRPVHAACTLNPAPDPTVDGSPNSLRAAIQTANASGQDCTIQLQSGTYTLTIKNTNGHENAANEGDLDITGAGHTLTLQGHGPGVSIVNAGGVNGIDDRVFHVLGGANAVFDGLTIEGGVANDNGVAGTQSGATESDGGGILVQDGGHLSLTNVALSGNQAIGGNGAAGAEIFLPIGMTNSLVGAPGSPGERAAGGGLFVSSGSVYFQNCKILENTAQGGAGGKGGYSAIGTGCAIPYFAFGAAGLAGDAAGGAIYILSGSVQLSRSTVSENNVIGGVGGAAGTLDFKDFYVGMGPGGIGGAGDGAGLYAAQGVLRIAQTTISNNAATGGVGGGSPNCGYSGRACDYTPLSAEEGGAARGGGIFILSSQVTVADSTLFANRSAGGAGGFISEGSSGSAYPPPTQGAGGDAAGGGVYAGGGSVTLRGDTVASNQALATSVESSSPGGSSGGGIANASATVITIDSTLIGDNTQDSGNASNGNDVLGAVTSSYSLIGQGAGATVTDDGGNVLNVDPLLDPDGLRSNGGPTQTVALQIGSPAIDVGDNTLCAEAAPAGLGSLDQRGYSRFPRGDSNCDIGAFEFYNLLVHPQGNQFGPRPVGQSSQPRSFTITNNQASSVTLRTTVAGANPGDFVANSTCGTTLGADATCTIKVVFKPIATGARSAVLLAGDSPDRTSPYAIKLTGVGQ